ncbi:MAG: acetate kinase [Candidatus Elarobacter sp.]
MRLLTVNAGSTSIKLEAYELEPDVPAIGSPPEPAARYADLERALADRFDAVAHRIVRVPDAWEAVTLLDPDARARIAGVGADAPLHDAQALRAVEAVRAAYPDVPQYAVADGAFHRTLSRAASTYAIPQELTRAGLRRRGYHGLSHQYAAHRAADMVGRDVRGARIVTLHLGGGSSLCAVRDGASVDTTMGYTPLEGVPMATRSGSVDPGLIVHLLRGGMTIDVLEETLERRSGLLGMSGRSGDARVLLAARDDDEAQLALDVFVWRTRSALGAMIAVLGGADLIAFTGGIGENAAVLRAQILEGAGAWGTVPAIVVAARENWMLARAVAAVGDAMPR